MSRINDLRRRLEAAQDAVEALDADLAAGRLGADEHARRREALEREAGQLVVDLRRARRQKRERPGPAPPAETPGGAWLRRPVALVLGALILVVLGIGGGVTATRWLGGARTAGPLPGTGDPPAGAAATATAPVPGDIEMQALRRLAAREDAPTPALLQLAHVELDLGRLAEARRLYDRVLARDPGNVEAITHLGGVLYQEGRVDEALARVEEALRLDPRYIHAHWDRTQYLFHAKRDFPAAARAAEAFLQVVPDGPDAEVIRRLLAEARQQAAPGRPGPPGPR